jgi:hypothetical protein
MGNQISTIDEETMITNKILEEIYIDNTSQKNLNFKDALKLIKNIFNSKKLSINVNLIPKELKKHEIIMDGEINFKDFKKYFLFLVKNKNYIEKIKLDKELSVKLVFFLNKIIHTLI